MKRHAARAVVVLGLVSLAAMAQGPRNVLLVINGNSADSRKVGDYYRQKRSIPDSNVCTLAVQTSEVVDSTTFERAIRAPIAECIRHAGMQDRILYIVLTKGVPMVVHRINAGSKESSDNSVDSELTLLYAELLGQPPVPVKLSNPYFARNARGGQPERFTHRAFAMYLVTRLDGYDAADAMALVDRALAAGNSKNTAEITAGRFILDQRADDETIGNRWLGDAATRLRAAGIPAARIKLEPTAFFLTGEDHVLGYASWGSNDVNDKSRYLHNHWIPGALMTEFVSSDARTFERPPEKWNIGKFKDSPRTFFHDTPQSLIGDYIHEGVTGVSGNVSEPLLEACARPQVLFPAYVQGLNLAESFYSALPFLNWKTVVIGDPLTQPFPRPPLGAEEADPPVNPATGLPAFFSKHLVTARARSIGEREDVTELLMTADHARRQHDFAAAHQAAERALKLAPDSQRTLELMAELSPPQQAIPLFRKVVEISPQNGGALNNLAYLLATIGGQPREALPFAARAADIAQGRAASVLDTYGWILYLLGQYQDARIHLEKAAAKSPSDPTVMAHLGLCYLKLGRKAEGQAQLDRALALHPDAATIAVIGKSR